MTDRPTRSSKRLPGAVRWAIAEGLISSVVTFLTTLITARFITPAEFGLATIAIAVQAVVQGALIDGPSIAIIRMKSADTQRTDAVLWGMLVLGVLAILLCCLLGTAIARFYGNQGLQLLISVQSLVCFCAALVAVPIAICTRKLRIRRLTLRMLWQKIATFLVTGALAIYGFGAWAVVYGSICGAIVGVIIIWLYQPRLPRLVISLTDTWQTLKLGWMIGLETMLSMLAIRMILILFGRFHGLHALGLVNFSLRLTDEIGSILSNIVAKTAMSVFSDLSRRGKDVASAYRAGAGAAALFSTPIFLGLASVFPTVVPLFFGERWQEAVIPAQVIAVLWSIRATRILAPALLRTHNIQGPLLINSVVAFTTGLLTVIVTADLSWTIALLAFVVPTIINLPSGVYYVSRFAHVSPTGQFGAVATQYLGGCVMAFSVCLLTLLLPHLTESYFGLGIQVANGVFIYAIFAFLFHRDTVATAWASITSKN